MNLEASLAMLRDGAVEAAMEDLFLGAARKRAAATPEEWKAYITAEVWTHPILGVVHEDPLTRRVFSKPRGYPGDAVMLDYIYGIPHPEVESGSDRGARILGFNLRSPAARAVRERRERLARAMDRVARLRPGARVLAVAAGHLREGRLAASLADGGVSELVAFDQDAKSLELVAREFAHLPVTCWQGTVRDVLARRAALGTFDFAYAAGLFDYLPQSTGRRLAAELFRAVRRGGSLLLANFATGIPGAGYMEAFMDWSLIYRTEAETVDLLAEIPQREIAQVVLTHDSDQNVVFVEATRA